MLPGCKSAIDENEMVQAYAPCLQSINGGVFGIIWRAVHPVIYSTGNHSWMNVGIYRPILAFNMNPAYQIFNYLSRQLQALKSRQGKVVGSRDCTYQLRELTNSEVLNLGRYATANSPKGIVVTFSRLQHIIIDVHSITDIRVYLYVRIDINILSTTT